MILVRAFRIWRRNSPGRTAPTNVRSHLRNWDSLGVCRCDIIRRGPPICVLSAPALHGEEIGGLFAWRFVAHPPPRFADISFQVHKVFVKPAQATSSTMQQEIERWKQLCEQIAVEQDPARFSALVKELITLLDEKERRIHQRRKAQAGEGA